MKPYRALIIFPLLFVAALATAAPAATGAGAATAASAAAIPAAASEQAPAGGLRVDVIVFTQGVPGKDANWLDAAPLPNCRAMQVKDGGFVPAFSGGNGCSRQPGESGKAVPASANAGSSALTTQLAKLKAGKYGVLWNAGWRQAPPANGNTLPVYASGTLGDLTLAGTVTVTANEKFPEVRFELVLTKAGEQPQYAVLTEARRVKPGELNYIDHPLFGALVQVTPAELP